MATGIDIVGVALAIPGITKLIINGGEVVLAKIDTYRKIDDTMARFVHQALRQG